MLCPTDSPISLPIFVPPAPPSTWPIDCPIAIPIGPPTEPRAPPARRPIRAPVVAPVIEPAAPPTFDPVSRPLTIASPAPYAAKPTGAATPTALTARIPKPAAPVNVPAPCGKLKPSAALEAIPNSTIARLALPKTEIKSRTLRVAKTLVKIAPKVIAICLCSTIMSNILSTPVVSTVTASVVALIMLVMRFLPILSIVSSRP